MVLLGQSDDSGHIKLDTQLFQLEIVRYRPNGRAREAFLLPWLQLLDAAIGRTEPTEDTKDLHAIKEELVSSAAAAANDPCMKHSNSCSSRS